MQGGALVSFKMDIFDVPHPACSKNEVPAATAGYYVLGRSTPYYPRRCLFHANTRSTLYVVLLHLLLSQAPPRCRADFSLVLNPLMVDEMDPGTFCYEERNLILYFHHLDHPRPNFTY